jgi:hypothetical protein
MPEFNGYLISCDDPVCHDLPLVDLSVLGSGGRNAHFSQTIDEHRNGVTVKAGDIVRVLVWFHNSGSEEKRSETTARDVRIGTFFDKHPATRHTISAYMSADNAQSIESSTEGGDATVKSVTPTTLQYIPNCSRVCLQIGDLFERGLSAGEPCGDYPEGKVRFPATVPDGVANGSVKIGDLKAGDNYTGYLAFCLRVDSQEASK